MSVCVMHCIKEVFKGTVKWWTKWRWSNCSCLTIFEFINHDKVTFLSARTSPNFFPLLSPSKTCALPPDFALERDPKNIFYYQHDVVNCKDQVLDFLLFDRHEYTHTESSDLILVSIFILRVNVTFSLFFKIWLTESVFIFRE